MHGGHLAISSSIARALASLFGIALLLLLVRLGFWQLERADEARALQAAVVAQAGAPPLTLTAAAIAANDIATLPWRRVVVRGRWASDFQVLLDNQVADGQAGYYVYTPLQIESCDCAVLVNRGWIPLGRDRQAVPDVGLAAEAAVISGTLAPPPPTAMAADLTEPLAPGLRRVQILSLPSLAGSLGTRILPLTIRLDPAAADGYLRNWAPPPVHAERHVAYAWQWFLMALVVAAWLVGMNLLSRLKTEQA